MLNLATKMEIKCLALVHLAALYTLLSQCSSKVSPVEEISDPKQFKQLLRTKTNVMVLFCQASGDSGPVHNVYRGAATEIRGFGTMVTVDCSGKGQKLCRQLKASPDPFVMHHYKDGKFHKVYDRQLATRSLARFMYDPAGDLPWEEDPQGKDVVHLEGPRSLALLLKTHKQVLVMFYAPWCVHCTDMKPSYAVAATKIRQDGFGVLAAMDLDRAENAPMWAKYNITGFPTVLYFINGEILTSYEGENAPDKILEFMSDPVTASLKTEEVIVWSEEKSDVHHLTTENFYEFIKDNPSTLVMFYASWCEHCTQIKPEWTKAASIIGKHNIAKVATVDGDIELKLVEQYKLIGFPTIKYFKNGEFAYDTPSLRDSKMIVDFLNDPKEPPPEPPPEPRWANVPSEVIHLTQYNFRSQLISKSHALIMFYDSCCTHCTAAKPEFEAAAEQLKEQPGMVLAAVNCIENPVLCKHFEIRGYPTYKYFKRQKHITDYIGGRKAADLVSFFIKITKKETDFFLPPNTVEITTTSPENVPSHPEQPAVETIQKEETEESPNYPGWDKIVHLTDDNYKNHLLQHKHLLILFYGKWCNHCKKLKPVFAEVAKDNGQSLITLGACDVDLSPTMVDEFLIESLPTVKYVRDGKSIVNYVGEQTAVGLWKFLQRIKPLQKEEL